MELLEKNPTVFIRFTKSKPKEKDISMMQENTDKIDSISFEASLLKAAAYLTNRVRIRNPNHREWKFLQPMGLTLITWGLDKKCLGPGIVNCQGQFAVFICHKSLFERW